MTTKEKEGSRYGTATCDSCVGEGGFYVGLRWFLCDVCMGRGWRRL